MVHAWPTSKLSGEQRRRHMEWLWVAARDDRALRERNLSVRLGDPAGRICTRERLGGCSSSTTGRPHEFLDHTGSPGLVNSPRTGEYISMIRRNIQDSVRRAMTDTPAVLLNGARQTGKTTLAQAMAVESGAPVFHPR